MPWPLYPWGKYPQYLEPSWSGCDGEEKEFPPLPGIKLWLSGP